MCKNYLISKKTYISTVCVNFSNNTTAYNTIYEVYFYSQIQTCRIKNSKTVHFTICDSIFCHSIPILSCQVRNENSSTTEVHIYNNGGLPLQGVSFQDCLYRQVANPRVLLEVVLRVKLILEHASHVTNILSRCRLREQTDCQRPPLTFT